MKYTYEITGVHCQSCLDKIQGALAPVANSIQLTLEPPTVTLTMTPMPSLEELNVRLALVGDYQLFPLAQKPTESLPASTSKIKTYYPLILIAAYIIGASFASNFSATGVHWQGWMHGFMAGFFLVFSGFKLLDLKGFKDSYASYDLLAKCYPGYGFIYPFLELGLGIAYLTHIAPLATYWATVIIMGFSSIGVIKALFKKQPFRCACLGTVLNLPISTITLVEDLLMVLMAVTMLVF